VENYLTDRPPRNYGGNLRHGVRSRAEASAFPSKQEIGAYLREVQEGDFAYLAGLTKADLAASGNEWGYPILQRLLYVLRHTNYHIGHAVQNLREHGAEADVW